MNTRKYNWILYLITATIVLTIGVQFYWNYKNYQENRTRVNNEIQISLDTAVEEYYSSISKKPFFTFIGSNDSIRTEISPPKDFFPQNGSYKGFFSQSRAYKNDSIKYELSSLSYKAKSREDLSKFLDSLIHNKNLKTTDSTHFHDSKQYPPVKINVDKSSDKVRIIRGLQSVYIALSNDNIDFVVLDSIFEKQLEKKDIQSDFYFQYYNSDSLTVTTRIDSVGFLPLSTSAKTTYLRPTQRLQLFHSDPTMSALKKSSAGILISFLLSLTVISSLFYLLKIINKQKELAEIKNDLISNITHEFKTPIATVSTAIEAIENFNVINDKEKTQKYLSMSAVQLKKLHQMVEKLLETATLDSERLALKKEEIDIIDLIIRIKNKHQILTEKEINFSTNTKSKFIKVDSFHFENTISNLIDNAIKYGGDIVEVNVNSVLDTTEISIADNGTGIEKSMQDKVFEKFYRVPKGNKHDVKGFGIGLYYTKKIIEKHGGSIQLISNNKSTIFKITIPNE